MGRRVFAASLAALAEAGLAFLIVAEVSVEGANASVGPLLIYPLFLAPFVARLWQRLIPFVVVLFFVGSLASRAVSMTVLERSRKVAGPVRRARDDLPAPAAFLGILVALMGLAARLGGSHGLLQRLG